MYNRTKKIIKKNTPMEFYDAARSLYLKTDIFCIGLGFILL